MRNSIIDIAKGIGIFLVVLGHNPVLGNESEAYRIVYSFHLPLFLFLSGTVLKHSENFIEIIKKRTSSLIKPYLLTLFVIELIYQILYPSLGISHFFGILFATGQTIRWVPLWFLPYLFVCLLVCSVIINSNFFKRQYFTEIFIVTLIIIGYFIANINPPLHLITTELKSGIITESIGLPLSLDLLPIGVAYILIGHNFSEIVKNISSYRNYKYITLAIVGFVSCHFYYNDTVNLNYRIYNSIGVTTLQALTGIYLSVLLASFFERFSISNNILSMMGKASITILIFHGIIQGMFISKISKHFPECILLAQITGLFAGLTIPLFIHYYLNKFKTIKRIYY